MGTRLTIFSLGAVLTLALPATSHAQSARGEMSAPNREMRQSLQRGLSAMADLQREISALETILERDLFLLDKLTDASRELKANQNHIGIEKALDKVVEAEKKALAIPQVSRPVLQSIGTLRQLIATKQMNPISTGMEVLTEQIHHLGIHVVQRSMYANFSRAQLDAKGFFALAQQALSAADRISQMSEGITAQLGADSAAWVHN